MKRGHKDETDAELPDLGEEAVKTAHADVGAGATLLEQMPTPVARSQLRAARVSSLERAERFNSLQYLSESLIKYCCLVLLSFLQAIDTDKAHGVSYTLSRSDSLGDWEKALGVLFEAFRKANAPQQLKGIVAWFVAKRSGDNDQWFRDAAAIANRTWKLTSDDPLETQASVRGLLTFLTVFRNKTRGHGAKPSSYFDSVNDEFAHMLGMLISQCPLLTEIDLAWVEDTVDGLIQRPLRGPAPSGSRPMLTEVDPGLVAMLPGTDVVVQFSRLFKYDAANDASYFTNGLWHDSDFSVEALDYLTGETTRLALSQFATAVPMLNRSETAGAVQLHDGKHAGHNLPALFPDYVRRGELEATLLRLLTDRTHRIITMRGMGGVGKTSLALRIAHELPDQSSCPFLWVVWFSARDIDLTMSGPKERRPDVRDMKDVAEQYCALFGIAAKGRQAIEIFARHVSDASEPRLLIMDNFESITNQREAQQYLDEAVILPNKVLITSRHERFQGDFPLEVKGMSDDEADALMRSEATRLGCADRLAPKVMRRIRINTSNVPYALKLVVGQLQRRELSIDRILEETLTHEMMLEALFQRSFDSLSQDAKQLYLMVGNWPTAIPAFALKAVLCARAIDVDEAMDECRRSSLVMTTERGTVDWCETPEVSRAFARAMLPVNEHSLVIERDLTLLRRLEMSGSWTSPSEFAARIAALVHGETNVAVREHEFRVLEALCSEDAAIWKTVARLKWRNGGQPDDVERAFRHAVEADASDWHTWYSYSVFEAQRGDYKREVELLIRACQRRSNDAKLNSVTAAKIAAMISGNKESFPLAERQAWTESVRANLESMFAALDADALARLGWLYWLQMDRGNAERCARQGLRVDPANTHCQNILRRLTETSRRSDYTRTRV